MRDSLMFCPSAYHMVFRRCGCGLTLLLASILSTGCMRAHLHLYPVCFYQTAPAMEGAQKYYAPLLTEVVHTTIKNPADVRAALSPDGRWLVASVTKAQNIELSKVWPRVGCIGDAHNSDSTKQEMDCVLYERSFLSGPNYFLFGNDKNPVLGVDIWNESPVPKSAVYCHSIEDKEPH